MENSVRIENRSQLIYLLTEAAELEHGIMCCYLYATFTLKTSTAEGVTAEQLSAIRRWRRLIRGISVEEMLHLGLACNLLTAVGGSPQVRRPNLPYHPRAYPVAFQLKLAPLSIETLESFVAIEKPVNDYTEIEVADTLSLPATEHPALSDIFSSERDYDTQGKLYRGIEDGLIYLAQKYGEEALFLGRSQVQPSAPFFGGLEGLAPVTDLQSALAAVDLIVRQGEGAKQETVDSHYSKFMSILEEYRTLLAADPAFEPARPALTNPYSIPPIDHQLTELYATIDDPATADISNLFDGCYELMIQMLGFVFVHAGDSEAATMQLADTTVGIMAEVLLPLGNALTQLPAGPSYPDRVAGPSFRLSRSMSIPTGQPAAWSLFQERLHELASYCSHLEDEPSVAPLSDIREALVKYAGVLASTPSS